MDEREKNFWTYGVHSVLAVLEKRPDQVAEIAVTDEGRAKKLGIKEAAEKAGKKIRKRGRAELDDLCGTSSHQGVAVLAPLPEYSTLEEVAERQPHVVLALDSITDPNNLGAMIRSGEALGASGLIIPKDRSAAITPAVHKASAGAAEWLPVAEVVNLSRALRELKEDGYWCYGADGSAEKTLQETEFEGKTVILIGSEGTGIRPGVKKEMDFLVKIDLKGQTESLNASAACAIILAKAIGAIS